MTAHCQHCGAALERQAAGVHRLCRACFAVDYTEGIRREAYAEGYQRGLASAERVSVPVFGAVAPPLDAAKLKAALTLTHPDHQPPERQDKANAVTAWLIELLQGARNDAPAT